MSPSQKPIILWLRTISSQGMFRARPRSREFPQGGGTCLLISMASYAGVLPNTRNILAVIMAEDSTHTGHRRGQSYEPRYGFQPFATSSLGPRPVPQSESAPANEPPEAGQGFLDVFHVGGVGAANEALATCPKRRAGNHRHLLLAQQLKGELLRWQSKLPHAGKGVERPQRTVALHSHLSESRRDEVPATPVFIDHLRDVRLGAGQRLAGGLLGQGRRDPHGEIGR